MPESAPNGATHWGAPTPPPEVIVAGHICLDVIPSFPGHGGGTMLPGSLTRIGPAVCGTGGAVANVGLALDRLGVAVRLIGKIGNDMFGRQVQACISGQNPGLGGTANRCGQWSETMGRDCETDWGRMGTMRGKHGYRTWRQVPWSLNR